MITRYRQARARDRAAGDGANDPPDKSCGVKRPMPRDNKRYRKSPSVTLIWPGQTLRKHRSAAAPLAEVTWQNATMRAVRGQQRPCSWKHHLWQLSPTVCRSVSAGSAIPKMRLLPARLRFRPASAGSAQIAKPAKSREKLERQSRRQTPKKCNSTRSRLLFAESLHNMLLSQSDPLYCHATEADGRTTAADAHHHAAAVERRPIPKPARAWHNRYSTAGSLAKVLEHCIDCLVLTPAFGLRRSHKNAFRRAVNEAWASAMRPNRAA